MRIRKSANTMTGLVLSLLLVIGIFTAGYQFLTMNMDDAGTVLETQYTDSYLQLNSSQAGITENVQAISDNLANVTEADSAFSVAWNGLKGLGNTLKLPYNFLNSARTIWGAFAVPLEIIPGWMVVLIFLGLSLFVIFLVLKILKGEPNM